MFDGDYDYAKLTAEELQSISFLRSVYKAIINITTKLNYVCEDQNDLQYAETDKEFFEALLEKKRNSPHDYNMMFSYMTNYWTKRRHRNEASDTSNRGFLIYCSDSRICKRNKITKTETRAAWNMLLETGAKKMLFIYDGELISSVEKNFTSEAEIPSIENYHIQICSAKELLINETRNIWMPVHRVVSDPNEFLKTNNLSRGMLPEIGINDKGLQHLEVKYGDIIEIEQDYPKRGPYHRVVTNSKNHSK